MTTQASYGQDLAGSPHTSDPYLSPPRLPVPQYPTAPPWAQQPPAPPYAADPGMPHTRHGQVLVRYPEELRLAARPRPPAVWPVAVWTLLFGVFGVVSVRRRAASARRIRSSTAPYWIVFCLALVVGGLVTAGLARTVAVPAYLEYRETAVLKQLQENIVTDGELQKSARLTATQATCRALGDRGSNGLRNYECELTLDGGRFRPLRVTADETGDWTVMKKKQ
ncbi:hypothetical protein [Krasilnikovia sp. MM14-A1259]|uniref:hypothetical protein n=1 Tax=Krasilnikovia sp. MM14-A1259 TaxID=3373539 RepID=UPI00399D1F4B